MKKLILFLSVIGAVTLMTSCLKGDNSYTDQGFVFIDTSSENGKRHGRTSGGRIITSNGIQTGMIGQTPIHPGAFYFFAFSWQEANGTVDLGQNMQTADNVTITSNIFEVPSTSLRMDSAPEISEGVPPFIAIANPLFAGDAFYWRDNWVFEFGYTGGETPPTLAFYKREISDTNTGTHSTNIDIDIRIESPASSGTQSRGHAVAVNMLQLRREFQELNNDHTLNIRFHFYREGQSTIHTSEPVRWVLARTSTSGQ
jgi:hypothetical protein